MRRLILILLFAALIAPYGFAVVVSRFQIALPDGVLGILSRAILQSSLSALFAVGLGFVSALGLLRVPHRFVRWAESFLLAGSFAPPIVLILAWMTYQPGAQGLWALVVIQGLSSMGVFAVTLSAALRERFGAQIEMAAIEGASRVAVWRGLFLPVLRSDLISLFLTAFAICLSSFSIPLLIGGNEIWSIEIAIHHVIRLESSWEKAAGLSLIQWSLQVFMMLTLLRARKSRLDEESSHSISESGDRESAGLREYGAWWGLIPALVLGALVIASLTTEGLRGWSQLMQAGLLADRTVLLSAFSASLLTSTATGLAVALFLLALALLDPSTATKRVLTSYVAPSVAITGFFTLFVGWGQQPQPLVDSLRIIVGGTLLLIPIVWRLQWSDRLARIERHVEVAMSLGADRVLIARSILWPQLRGVFFWSWGLVSFWMWGDFGVGSIAASRPMTLALVARTLMESYRIEAAALLIGVCLCLGALSFGLIAMAGESRDRVTS